jgi:hypothetical protein
MFKVNDPKDNFSSKKEYPSDSKEVKVPVKEIYPTFEIFMRDYAGLNNKNKFKRYGYWSNPRAKWDWYQIGGRWSGTFKLKPGEKGSHGKRSWTNKDEEEREGYVDQARKGQIDFAGMRQEDGDKAGERYDLIESLLHGHIPMIERSWEEIRDSAEFKDNIDGARDAYHEQSSLVLFSSVKDKVRKNEEEYTKDQRDFIFWASLEDFQCTKEEYVQRARDAAVSFYSVLMNGKWYEKGEMGWWGMSFNEKDKNMWYKQQADLFDGIPDDTLLTVVDCHI